ncbi:putative F-box protein [Arabidopsis thaliana]
MLVGLKWDVARNSTRSLTILFSSVFSLPQRLLKFQMLALQLRGKNLCYVTLTTFQALANTNIELPGQITFVQGSNLNDPTSTQRLVLRYRIDSSVIVYLSLWDDVAATFRAHLSSGRAEELEGELISLRTSRGARERAEELEDFILDLGRAKIRGAIHPPTCPMELSVFFFPRSSNINSYSLKGASANDERVLKTLNLAPLVKKPLSCRKHLLIMKKCLANNNPDAHYIKGIIWYFNLDHCDVGLHHIGIAANGGQKEAIYMYVMLLLCRGRTEEGKTYMSQLEWAKDTTMAETCWKQIKTSLNGIRVARKRCYMISLRNMKPPDVCHPRNLDNTYQPSRYRFEPENCQEVQACA